MSYIALDKAQAEGFTIDRHCYPWVAYKGPRFSPSEWHVTDTDIEFELKQENIRLMSEVRKLHARDCEDRT